jgi:hypothetical protein
MRSFVLAGQTVVPATQGGRGDARNVGKDKTFLCVIHGGTDTDVHPTYIMLENM